MTFVLATLAFFNLNSRVGFCGFWLIDDSFTVRCSTLGACNARLWADYGLSGSYARNRLLTTRTRSRLRGRCLPLSDDFQSEIVVHGMAEFLLAAEIALGCLNRCVSKQELNLLKFSAC